MKVAELKRRLVVGTRLTLVNSLLGPCRKLRTVENFNSVGFQLTGDGIAAGRVSHMTWPKASELVETSNGFQVLEGSEVAVAYEWGHNPAPESN